MKEYISSVSPKGQITLPQEVRRLLGIQPKDKVAIQLEENKVTIALKGSALLEGYRSVPALPRRLTDREMTDIATEDAAQEAAREGL